MLRGSREVVALFPSRNANRWSFYEDRNASRLSEQCQEQADFGEVDAAIDERAASVAVDRRCYTPTLDAISFKRPQVKMPELWPSSQAIQTA